MKATTLDRGALGEIIQSRRADFTSALRRLVEIPSVSLQSEHRADCRRAGEVACRLIEEKGGRAELVETGGNPVVLGTLEGPAGAPTVSFYNHLDVQPATDGADGWTRHPFRFEEEGDRFYGRGATDDKGPAVAALLGAALAREQGVAVNVRFLWELEEEIGSAHFEPFLERRRDDLRSNCIVVSDTIWLAKGKPAIPYGLRGLAAATLRLETGGKEAHSGLAGGAARNPLVELCEVIARCIDGRTGDITIEGFDRTWTPPTREEIDGFVSSGFDAARFLEAHGLRSPRTSDPREITGRIWARPTFEVHGITGGYQGEGVKTIVPPWAEAKVSFRLVPPQQPEVALELLRAHVKRLNPDVEVRDSHGIPPYLGERRGPVADAAADAMEFGFGARPAFIREGGSIGAVLLMDRHLRAPITLLGLSLPEQGYHGPNEFFDWGQASGGMATFAYFLERMANRA